MSARFEAFWAQFFGISPADWALPGVSVNAHVGLGDYAGAWFFVRRARLVISAPAHWVSRLRSSVEPRPFDELTSEHSLRALFGAAFERRLGPAYQGSLAPERFAPYPSPSVRAPRDGDEGRVRAFRAACGDEAARDAAFDEATLYRAACFEGAEIVALSGYRPWTDTAGDPCVLTHPGHRQRGLGTAVVAHTVARALADGKLLLYQTLEANRPAVQLAERLGYEWFARYVAVRLRA